MHPPAQSQQILKRGENYPQIIHGLGGIAKDYLEGRKRNKEMKEKTLIGGIWHCCQKQESLLLFFGFFINIRVSDHQKPGISVTILVIARHHKQFTILENGF